MKHRFLVAVSPVHKNDEFLWPNCKKATFYFAIFGRPVRVMREAQLMRLAATPLQKKQQAVFFVAFQLLSGNNKKKIVYVTMR